MPPVADGDGDLVFARTFQELDEDKDGFVTKSELESSLKRLREASRLDILEGMELLRSKIAESQNQRIDIEEFKKMCREICQSFPLIGSDRLQWAKSLGMEIQFSSLLEVGTLWDGMKGIRDMSKESIQQACAKFSKQLEEDVLQAWKRLQPVPAVHSQPTLSQGQNDSLDAVDMMSKFIEKDGAFYGKYGTRSAYEGGLEACLGVAHPWVFRAIVLEHVSSVDSEEAFRTTNYNLYTTPMLEFARLLGNGEDYVMFDKVQVHKDLNPVGRDRGYHCGPTMNEIKDLQKEFGMLRQLYDRMTSGESKLVFTADSCFPGDIGDRCMEHDLDVFLQGVRPRDQDHAFDDSARANLCQAAKNAVQIVNNLACARNADKKVPFLLRGLNITREAVMEHGSPVVSLSLRVQTADLEQEWAGEYDLILSCFASHFVEEARKAVPIDEHSPSPSYRLLHVKDTDNPRRILYHDAEAPQQGGSSARLKPGRNSRSLGQIMAIPMVTDAQLRLEEAIVEYQYTGPLFQKWNGVLRSLRFPQAGGAPVGGNKRNSRGNKRNSFSGAQVSEHENKYTTTIHTLVSAILKTSKVTKIPVDRKVYRGLGGMVLDKHWVQGGEDGVCGGVELGFLSTTCDRDVAVMYSGADKKRGIVFEIAVGAIDRGAELKQVSQYPGEAELLFSPLAHLEVVGKPRVEWITGAGQRGKEQVVVMPLDININAKSLTMEEMLFKRKHMILEMYRNLFSEVRHDMEELCSKDMARICLRVEEGDTTMADSEYQIREIIREAAKESDALPNEWFNADNNFPDEMGKLLLLKYRLLKAFVVSWRDARFASLTRKEMRGESARAEVAESARKEILENMGTVMAWFVERGREDIVAMLLECGARIDLLGGCGSSTSAEALMQSALDNSCHNVVALLVRVQAHHHGILMTACHAVAFFGALSVLLIITCFISAWAPGSKIQQNGGLINLVYLILGLFPVIMLTEMKGKRWTWKSFPYLPSEVSFASKFSNEAAVKVGKLLDQWRLKNAKDDGSDSRAAEDAGNVNLGLGEAAIDSNISIHQALPRLSGAITHLQKSHLLACGQFESFSMWHLAARQRDGLLFDAILDYYRRVQSDKSGMAVLVTTFFALLTLGMLFLTVAKDVYFCSLVGFCASACVLTGFPLLEHRITRSKIADLINTPRDDPRKDTDDDAAAAHALPLHMAAACGNADVVSALLDIGAQADRVDPARGGGTALHAAVAAAAEKVREWDSDAGAVAAAAAAACTPSNPMTASCRPGARPAAAGPRGCGGIGGGDSTGGEAEEADEWVREAVRGAAAVARALRNHAGPCRLDPWRRDGEGRTAAELASPGGRFDLRGEVEAVFSLGGGGGGRSSSSSRSLALAALVVAPEGRRPGA